MEITGARLPDDVDEIVDFVVARTPEQDRVIVRSGLNQQAARSLRVLVAREFGGALAGVGVAQAEDNLPAGALYVMVHAHARDLGIRMARTDNEESNAGIRHVNDRLGYTPHSAWHWLMRDVADLR